MKKQIVFILSTNYAGSHLLALQLGSHSDCTSIGELHHLRKGGFKNNLCYHCGSDDICPVLSGVKNLNVEDFHSRVFQNLARHNPNVRTIIENSKKTRWAKHFLQDSEYSVKFIHLIRDPRALVRRWIISYDNLFIKSKVRFRTARRCWKKAANILLGNESNVYIWKWLKANNLITKFIAENKLDAKTVTYRELVLDTDNILSELMQSIGMEYEPEQKEYWNFTHHGTVKPNYMKPPKNDKKWFDQRWKDFLAPEIQQKVFKNTNINQYLENIGFKMLEEGGLAKNQPSVKMNESLNAV